MESSTLATLGDLIKRLETATVRLEKVAGPVPVSLGNASSTEDPKSVVAFDESVLETEKVKTLIASASEIGGPVKEQAGYFIAGLRAMRGIILAAASAKRPSGWPSDSKAVIAPLEMAIQQVVNVKEKNRTHASFNHLAAMADGIPSFGWVVVEPKPAPYATEMRDAAQFYANRATRDKKPIDVALAGAYMGIFNDIVAYIKQHHTTGLRFTGNGELLTPSNGPSKINSHVSSGGMPPPPPPPPMATFSTPVPPKPEAPVVDFGNVLNELNKGSAITASLRKVDPSQMTHKNPDLRASGIVKAKESHQEKTNNAPSATKKQGTARVALEGNKWIVEHCTDAHDIQITDTSLKTVVYIYGCTNATIQIKGKVNSVAMDACRKTGVVVDAAVSTVDIVHGKQVQLQVIDQVPTIAIDNSDGVTVFLSQKSINAEILTSKVSEVNVMLPPKQEGGDFREMPIPEQFISKIDSNTYAITTNAVEHSSA